MSDSTNKIQSKINRCLKGIFSRPVSSFVWFLIFVPFISFAQNQVNNKASLSGIVADVNGSPLAFATVTVSGRNATSTDNAGKFEIKNLPPGRNQIAVSLVGYQHFLNR